jgi:hypothetical protein
MDFRSSMKSKRSAVPKKPVAPDTMKNAIRHVIFNEPLRNVVAIGGISLPEGPEARRYLAVKDILEDYADRDKVYAPLSIAVFGPPGSGKSKCVREILSSLSGTFKPPLLVNLSQLSDPRDLAGVFRGKLDPCPGSAVDVVFFDEFDAPLKGDPLGWLRWFLAPMQDSEFFFEGETIRIGKAVLVFAGGTAESMTEFQDRAKRDLAKYREQKVPDFISRLHGFIDIEGINRLNQERAVRRALALRYQLTQKRWPELMKKGGRFPIERKLVASLLSNVHFVHGLRSMQALLDMSCLGSRGEFGEQDLPDNDLRRLHLSRGPLDGKLIGISAGPEENEAAELLKDLTDKLLRSGATLAYGGDFTPTGTLTNLLKAMRSLPEELVTRLDKRVRNYLGFPTYLRKDVGARQKRAKNDIDFLRLPTLSIAECRKLGVPRKKWFPARPMPGYPDYDPKKHLAWAISLFRMRLRLVNDIDALIVVGGKDGDSWGRFSGIAEEVALALEMDKPVYVLGGRKGAAQAVGQLLGLDKAQADPEKCLQGAEVIPGIEKFASCFDLPGRGRLLSTAEQVRTFLFDRGVTTQAWPPNGLTAAENRELFSLQISPRKSRQIDRSVELILRGLSRLDWTDSNPRIAQRVVDKSQP